MTTLGIFTVKRLCKDKSRYYTYGGFGEYLAAMRSAFDRVILVAHVKDMRPPPGHYMIPPGEDLEIVHLPQVRSELGVLLTLPLMLWRSWVVARRMDVAHARMPDYTGIVGAFVCRMRGVPLFCQIIADWYLEAQRMSCFRKCGLGLAMKVHLYLYDLMERLVCRRQMVFAQGQTCYDKHCKHADCEMVLSAAHHMSDIVAPAPRFGKSSYTILNVARLTGVKNQELIIDALAKLRAEQQEEWRVVFVGEGPHREALIAKVRALGLEACVQFAGQIERGAALWKFFDTADCFVLSSRSEGSPKVILEAMARGLPVVAAAVAGVPTIVRHEERGLLFKDNDVETLVAALRRIATDATLRESLVANALRFCAEHTVEQSTARMLEKVFLRWPSLRPKTGSAT